MNEAPRSVSAPHRARLAQALEPKALLASKATLARRLVSLVAVVGFGALSLSACANPLQGKPNSSCVDKVVQSYRDFHSHGIWECMTLGEQATQFDNNGWQNDSDITNWLQNAVAQGVEMANVEAFKGNPVPVTDKDGNQFQEYHFRITPIDTAGNAYPTFSMIVVLNSAGQITSIQ